MTPKQLAQLVETSEARAYSSLIGSASSDLAREFGFRQRQFDSALAITAESLPASLVFNRVLGLGVLEPATEQVLDAIDEHFRCAGVSYAVELSLEAKPGLLPTWLRARRIRRGFASAMLYRNTEPPPNLSTEVRVDRIGPEHAQKHAEICCSVFRMPDAVRGLLAGAIHRPEWRHWVAFQEQTPIAASLSFVGERTAWLGWTATLPAYRGLWAHAAIVAEQIRDASRSGCEWITTETAASTKEKPDPAHYNLTAFGFKEAYVRPTYVWVKGVSK